MIQLTREDRVFETINVIIVSLVSFVILYPLVFVVSSSFSDPDFVNTGRVWLFPRAPNIDAYKVVLEESQVWRGYRNTVFYVATDVVISVLVIIPAAYALARNDRVKFTGFFTFFFTFTMLFSGGIIPLYLVMRSLGMINTVWALTVPSAAGVYLIIIARTFFRTGVPKDLYDAATIDGASFSQTFFRIVVPLSPAIIAVVALFKGVQQWNNFFRPLVFITDVERYPLPLVLRNILLANEAMVEQASEMGNTEAMAAAAEQGRLAETMKYSLIVISTVPVLAIYPFLQRYFMTGVMIGSIKG